jgi:hypothetical protein
MEKMERTLENKVRVEEMERLRQKGWSLREIGQKYGISRERVRQLLNPTPKVAQRLSAEYKLQRQIEIHNSSFGIGDKAEHITSRKLWELGIPNTEMLSNDPFDILVQGEIKIDVKSRMHRELDRSWSFGTGKKRKGDYADFFILYIWETSDYFVIPSEVAINTITFTWAPIKRESRWHQYHNRFDLLEARCQEIYTQSGYLLESYSGQ